MGMRPDFLKSVHSPIPLIDPGRVRRNIHQMAILAKTAGVRFRPHFKTHQSSKIGEWFRDAGVTGITVSSVAMARYFAESGWTNITLAFPFNIRELEQLNQLDEMAEIHLLADHPDTVSALAAGVTKPHRVFIKVDTGYHRTGISWKRRDKLLSLAKQIESAPNLSFAGILTHAGHSYHADSPGEVQSIFRNTVSKMNQVRKTLHEDGIQNCVVSIGNTPGCTVTDSLNGVDEIRPGNFVFYDLMQLSISICDENVLAMALLCPVTGIYPDRNELVLLGGATHFSKERFRNETGETIFGYGIGVTEAGFGPLNREIRLIGLSQEHGIVRASAETIRKTRIGDILAFVPVHSCLTADLYSVYLSTSGDRIPRFNSVSARSAQLLPSVNNNSLSF